jgi:hypothetical protein
VRRTALGLSLGFALASVGCEISEVTIAEARDVVVAEVYVQVGESTNRVTGFLHRSLTDQGDGLVPDADIRITINGGPVVSLFEVEPDECLVESEDFAPVGSCYLAGPLDALLFQPGDDIELTIELPTGEQLVGETTIAAPYNLVSPEPSVCALPPLTSHLVEWTAADGAWAYVSETRISGLTEALEGTGIDVEQAPLDLVGVSVSAADTTIVFPSEFGLFERFDLDRDLAVLLQQGLPEGTTARVLVGALDRNWVNWVRGGDFNPSGQVRVPSVRGDGTGVFGSTVVLSATFSADPERSRPDLEPCGP